MITTTVPNANSPFADLRGDAAIFELMTGSFARLVGRPLVPDRCGPGWLYAEAPFPVLAHDTADDPRFIYVNRAAEACFGYAFEAFVGLPSRLSAEAPDRAERQRLLDAVSRDGFTTGYRGIRVRNSGERFWIEDGIVWQLIDRNGVRRGQAATFTAWTPID